MDTEQSLRQQLAEMQAENAELKATLLPFAELWYRRMHPQRDRHNWYALPRDYVKAILSGKWDDHYMRAPYAPKYGLMRRAFDVMVKVGWLPVSEQTENADK